MKFALQIFTDYAQDHATLWRQIRQQAETAQESGFDGVFVPADIAWRRLDALSTVAALASVTDRIVVGTNIITLPLYAPLQVAEAVATADLISGGRTVLGIASGWRADEFAAAGIPLNQRIGRMYESVHLMKAFWTQPSVTFHGKYYQVDQVALELKPLQKPHPPLWVGAHVPAAIERAARAGMGWIEGSRTSLRKYSEKQRLYLAAMEEAGHRLTDMPLLRDAFVAERSAEARRTTAGPLMEKMAEYARQGKIEGKENTTFDNFAPGRFIIGSVEECGALVQEYVDAGVNWLVLRMQYTNSDPERVLENIKLWGAEVAPRFKTT